MLQARRELDLAQKPLGAKHRRQFRMEHLDRHFSLVPHVAREENGGHAPLPKLAFDDVTVVQRIRDAFEQGRQRREGLAWACGPGAYVSTRRCPKTGASLGVTWNNQQECPFATIN